MGGIWGVSLAGVGITLCSNCRRSCGKDIPTLPATSMPCHVVPHTTYDRRRRHNSHSSRPRPGLSLPSIPTILAQPGRLLPSRYPHPLRRGGKVLRREDRNTPPPLNRKLTRSTRWLNGKSEQACRSHRVTNTITITPPIGVSSPVLPCGCGGKARVARCLVPERGEVGRRTDFLMFLEVI